MKKLTDEPLIFEKLSCFGHLYAGVYDNECLAVFAGEQGTIGKLSVNIPSRANELKKNQFFVKLYGTGEIMNPICLKSGLFRVVGSPFEVGFGIFQKWELKE